MAWTLFAISRYPPIEEHIVKELESLGLLATASNPNPRDVTYDDLGRLPYLTCVIMESMRMYTVRSPPNLFTRSLSILSV
jgi:cytochrome P450